MILLIGRTKAKCIRPDARVFARHAAVLAAATALLLLCSCATPEDPASGSGGAALVASEVRYVDYMAALAVALEEGATGEEAASRVAELGASVLSESEIEEMLQRLDRDPVHWADIERTIDRRIEQLRAETRRQETDQEQP